MNMLKYAALSMAVTLGAWASAEAAVKLESAKTNNVGLTKVILSGTVPATDYECALYDKDGAVVGFDNIYANSPVAYNWFTLDGVAVTWRCWLSADGSLAGEGDIPSR